MKQMNEKQKRALKLKLEKHTLESKKEYFNKLVEAIIEYRFEGVPFQAISYDESWRRELDRNVKLVEASGLNEKKQNELRRIAIPIFTSKEELEEWKKSGLTDEEWRSKRNIKYIDKKIKEAESLLKNANYDVKKKIVEDCISKRLMWYDSISASSKIRSILSDKKKEGKK